MKKLHISPLLEDCLPIWKGKLDGHCKAQSIECPVLKNFPFYVCFLQRRFHSMLKGQHSQWCPAPHVLLIFMSSETAIRDATVCIGSILILQNKKQDRRMGRLWPKQSLKQFTNESRRVFEEVSTWRDFYKVQMRNSKAKL